MVSSISSSTSSWAMQRPDSSQMASKLFSKLDTKNQGYIEKSDLTSAFSQISSSESTSSVDELFSQLDSDSNGKVTQSELADTLKKLSEQLDAGFNNMRMSGAGGMGGPGGAGGMPPPPAGEDKGMTKDELTTKASEVSSTDSKLSSLMSTAAANFEAADTDQDGKVTAKEAMAYQQKQDASATASSTSTTGVASTSDSQQMEVLRRIMQLVQAYGGFGQESGQNDVASLSSLSVIA